MATFMFQFLLLGIAIVSVNGCGEEFVSSTRKNGTFTSPLYPNPYPADTTCIYNFSGQAGERVQITFTDLDLYYPHSDPSDPFDCEDVDSVTIRIIIDNEFHNIGVYCGQQQPPKLMSNNQQLEVTFRSHQQSSARGFSAHYNFVTDYGISSGVQVEDMECDFSFRSEMSPNGTFTSPNYPGLYPRETVCNYRFFGKGNERISVNFPDFAVEGIQPSCSEDTQSDYVEFSNFNIVLPDRKMSRYCGVQYEDHTINSDGNFFKVTFKSNDIYDDIGFKAFYQFNEFNADEAFYQFNHFNEDEEKQVLVHLEEENQLLQELVEIKQADED